MSGNERPIRLLHHLARTGGKAISRCLASMPEVVLLSEIHPRGGHTFDPLQQAFEWYQLVSLPEVVTPPITDDDGFLNAIELIEQRTHERGRTLVIRDWSHLDYTGVPFTDSPPFRLTLAEVLGRRFPLIQTTTVRHPVDQWLSIAKTEAARGRLGVEAFLAGYRRFAEEAVRLRFVRYEDFIEDPDAALGTLCERLSLAFDPGYRGRWHDYRNVTGEIQPDRARAGLERLPRRSIEEATLDGIRANADYRAAVEMLGYD